MNNKDIEEIILSWFKKKNIKLKDLKENFIYSKKIDSMDSIQLIIFIEKKFKYKFKKKDLMASNFFTVKKITKIIKDAKYR
jgi:acyl carrier protein|tara:strand:+ start:309 stop:551 length:243 start_codon:yes stop_codon:yes gene_type:complete